LFDPYNLGFSLLFTFFICLLVMHDITFNVTATI
jgi:hypothetical protein